MAYKMLAFDLDGTLNNDDKVITPKTKEAIMSLQKQGVVVALVSGRQAPGLKREAEALELDKYHGLRISYNGGRIEDATTKEILFDSSIDNETAVKFLRHLEPLAQGYAPPPTPEEQAAAASADWMAWA